MLGNQPNLIQSANTHPNLESHHFIADLNEKVTAFGEFIAKHGKSFVSKEHADERF